MTATPLDSVMLECNGLDVDWDDIDAVGRWSAPILGRLADRSALLAALDRVRTDEHLSQLCEASEMIEKMVIFDDPVASVRIRWDSYPGKTYRVEYRSSLSAGTWTQLGGDVPATGASTCWATRWAAT